MMEMRPMNPLPILRTVLIIAVGLSAMLAACSAEPGASTDLSSPSAGGKVLPSDAAPPVEKPTPTPDCLNRSIQVSTIEPTTENLGKVMSTVIVGTFDGFGEAQWNTLSGDRPASSEELGTLIVRPVKITAEKALRGDLDVAKDVRLQGGTVGCSREAYSSEPLLKEGQTYVFFLGDDPEPSHKDSSIKLLGWAWPVTADGEVETPLEGTSDISSIQTTLDETPLLTK